MTDWLTVTVRFLHILFGVAWVGSALFYGHGVMAGFRKADPDLRRRARRILDRKVVTLFAAAGPLTLLFGLWTQLLTFKTLTYSGTLTNVALGAGLIVTLIMLGVVYGMQLPAMRRLGRLEGNVDPRDADELAGRIRRGTMIVAGLGVVVLALMVVAAAGA